MKIWGIHKRYKSLSWFENFMGGHLSIGPITIYGANAMNWAVNIRTRRWGYLCFTIPCPARYRMTNRGERVYQWYIYLSPNGTPWASTFYRGSNKAEIIRAKIRKYNFGHGFSSEKLKDELYALNHKFDWFKINEYDLEIFGNKERT